MSFAALELNTSTSLPHGSVEATVTHQVYAYSYCTEPSFVMRTFVPMLGTVRSEKLCTSTCAGSPGVAVAVPLGKLSPISFTARILKSYEVLSARPVTVAVVAVLDPSAKTAHDPPVVSWYSTM